MTTGEVIDALVTHYGSIAAVNAAAAKLWVGEDNKRIMPKVDALYILYENLQKEKQKCKSLE